MNCFLRYEGSLVVVSCNSSTLNEKCAQAHGLKEGGRRYILHVQYMFSKGKGMDMIDEKA